MIKLILLYFEGITWVQIVLMSIVALIFMLALALAWMDVKFKKHPVGRKCWLEFNHYKIPGEVINVLGDEAQVKDDSGAFHMVSINRIKPRYGMY